MVLLIAGSFLSSTPRAILWLLAVAIDYAGPGWLTRERLRGIQQVAVAHFAERYSLFVIICLGESIVTIGVGARGRPLSATLVAAVSLGLLITIGLWWTYFDRFAEVAERRLRGHDDPVLAASDAYSYIHLLIVAGIIIFAVGVNEAVHDASRALPDSARLALCGGVALYLLGHAAFRLRLLRTLSYGKPTAVLALGLLFAFGGGVIAWALAAAIAAVIGALCATERWEDHT